MKGFKDSTKTQYSMGGSCYAKGGAVKGAAKVAKVMGEFKSGELHSGSKKGPKVTNPKQAIAISLSEARKAGAKVPMKKYRGGDVNDRTVDESSEDAVMRLPRDEADFDKRHGLVVEKVRKVLVSPMEGMKPMRNTPASERNTDREAAMMAKRGPAGKTYTDVPMIDNAINSVRSRLGLKKGGLAVMPRGKKC